MFTPTQVKDMAKIAPSTLRKYVSQFPDHFSDSARKRRGRMFSQDDIAVVMRIKKYYSEGYKRKKVDDLLLLPDDTPSPGNVLAMVPTVSRELDDIRSEIARDNTQLRDGIRRLYTYQENQLDQIREEHAQEITQLEEQIKSDRENFARRYHTQEERIKQLEEKNKPFWERIFRNKTN